MPELRGLPDGLRIGVYVFKGPKGEILYIGKSTDLRRRVLDHLREEEEKDSRINAQYDRIEFIPTQNEREALLLEANLIRQHQPRYNVLLKDDRSYPYIALSVGERFPRVSLVRRPKRKKGVLLFGPYMSAREARSLVQVLAEALLLRRCRTLPKVACLYYHMGTCSAPCIGAIDKEAYRRRTEDALKVLRGRGEEILPALQREMGEAAKRLDFERAARLRDAIAGMDGLKGRQSVVGTTGENLDVVALTAPTEEGIVAAVGLVKVRAGQVVGAESRILSMPPGMGFSREDLLSVFLLQDYALRRDLPPILYLSSQDAPGVRSEGAPGVALEGPLACLAEKGVTTRYAVSGRPRSLLSLAESTGRARLATTETPRDEALLEETQRFLSLPQTPRHIEGVDISILQGTEAVGSLVVFRDGRPAKPEYRRFQIKGVPGMNDFAMVHEVVRRRFSRLKAEDGEMPDLLLVDGGAGQVAAAASALESLELASLPLIGLAKRHEEVYLPGRKEPLRGDKNGRPLLLLRHVRDEAHRFAITYHRKRRQMALRAEKEA